MIDLSGISTSLNTQTLASTTTVRSELQPQPIDESAADLKREDLRGLRGRRGLALGILKQELRAAIRLFINAQPTSETSAYTSSQEPDSPSTVADEILGGARQAVAEAPTDGAETLSVLRSTVEASAGNAKDTIGVDYDGIDQIDNTTSIIGDGLDELSAEVANYRESTASILAVDTSTRERSTIQIRTQEGDFVKLYLRRTEDVAASDIAYADGETSFASTEVALSSSARTLLQVKGDLNDSELAAIRTVFAQAENIADEFFGGDIGAAFNSVQSTNFDSEQLARVDLRFRMQRVTSAAYTQVGTTTPLSVAPTGSAVVASAASAGAETEPLPEIGAANAVQPDAIDVGLPVTDETPGPQSIFTAMADFLDTLSAFLRSVGDGFEAERSSSNYTYHYSESFKLNLLKAVINAVAPEDATDAAANAELVIDNVTADT